MIQFNSMYILRCNIYYDNLSYRRLAETTWYPTISVPELVLFSGMDKCATREDKVFTMCAY